MRTRAAGPEDAAALGRVMVASWLSAHRGQVPEAAWNTRAVEWTPDVSARGWARVLAAQRELTEGDDILLVAEDDHAVIVGLVHGAVPRDGGGAAAGEIASLYVAPDRLREGVGAALLRAGAGELQRLGATSVRVSVLTANGSARRFYEALGGRAVGHGTAAEDGTALPTTVYEWSDIGTLADR